MRVCQRIHFFKAWSTSHSLSLLGHVFCYHVLQLELMASLMELLVKKFQTARSFKPINNVLILIQFCTHRRLCCTMIDKCTCTEPGKIHFLYPVRPRQDNFLFIRGLTPVTLLPLFHTGHESPESPRIDFFFIRGGGGGGGGIREVSLNCFLQS